MKLFPGAGARLVPPHAVPAGALDDLLATHQVAGTFVAEHVINFRKAVPKQAAPVVGVTRGGRALPGRRAQAMALTGACWVGSNVVPVTLDEDGLDLVASHLLSSRAPRVSLFGPQPEVLGLWDRLRTRWSQPFAVRREQPLLKLEGNSKALAHPEVRVATTEDYPLVLPASAAMFEEEVGYSPYVDGDTGYVRRVARLIEQQRTFVLIRDGRVVFKADAGAAAGAVCQIQGVWVDPAFRGRGWAVPCMTAVVEVVRRRWPVVSLYVNSYNLPALNTYHGVGFRQVGTFATVLF